MPVILPLRRVRQEDHEIKESLAYIRSLMSDYTVYQDSVKGEERKEEGGRKRK